MKSLRRKLLFILSEKYWELSQQEKQKRLIADSTVVLKLFHRVIVVRNLFILCDVYKWFRYIFRDLLIILCIAAAPSVQQW